ncbi:MAG: hypothetical protein A2Y38_11035 [Spirochaetes bacterium GWB1_59_5]|nr:MAG: hypothetical protein A2Y38_11035 [Spirochaetes bacterium GWB1_59_5]
MLAASATSLPGIAIEIGLPPDPAARLLGLDGAAVIAVRGDSKEEAGNRADYFEAAVSREAGSAFSAMVRSPVGTKPRIIIRPRRAAAATLDISLADAAVAIRAATQGVKATALRSGGRESAVMVFAGEPNGIDSCLTLSAAYGVPVSVVAGNSIPVSSIATFERTDDQAALARLDRADVVYLEFSAAPGRAKELSVAVEKALLTSSGSGRSDESAFRIYGNAMAGAVLLVLLLLYLTLGAQFESFGMPVAIMATIPLAMAGVGPALVLSGVGLDSGSILGLVVLFGVVVNNAILLHEASDARRQAGAGPVLAAFAGASDRVRPVLATTLTTIVALLPMCLSATGAAQRSMAVAVLGGLAASTALTLFISPIAFAAAASRKSA